MRDPAVSCFSFFFYLFPEIVFSLTASLVPRLARLSLQTRKPVDQTHKPIDWTHKPVDRTRKPVDRTRKPVDRTRTGPPVTPKICMIFKLAKLF